MDKIYMFWNDKNITKGDAIIVGIISAIVAGVVILVLPNMYNKVKKKLKELKDTLKDKVNIVFAKHKERKRFKKFVKEYNKTNKVQDSSYLWLMSLSNLTKKQRKVRDQIMNDNFNDLYERIKVGQENIKKYTAQYKQNQSNIIVNDIFKDPRK
ncbi:hypothetical protein LF65_02268 [Clostridium beijerinckii]|uniref:Uncharacterized protein n=1 Tax=Clostridium beijerinckii TaxID=1520 RepID=A0A0B5Q9E6_CLOBE|nr:hypothetical protein [Clostridium beijerinckii]AJG98854.1 hypothetical protein LF65_02268 [Clostridium beijerinckii]